MSPWCVSVDDMNGDRGYRAGDRKSSGKTVPKISVRVCGGIPKGALMQTGSLQRGKGATSAHRHGLSSPCTIDPERACPVTQPRGVPTPSIPDRMRSASGHLTRPTGAPAAVSRWTDPQRSLAPSRLPASGFSCPDTRDERCRARPGEAFRRFITSRRTPPAPQTLCVTHVGAR